MATDIESGEWTEITGGDVWTAVKRGVALSFFIGITVGVGMMFTAKDGTDGGLMAYVRTLIACLVFGITLYVPLNLAVVATSRCRGFLPGLLRFAHGLVVFAGISAMVLVYGARILCHLMKIGA